MTLRVTLFFCKFHLQKSSDTSYFNFLFAFTLKFQFVVFFIVFKFICFLLLIIYWKQVSKNAALDIY